MERIRGFCFFRGSGGSIERWCSGASEGVTWMLDGGFVGVLGVAWLGCWGWLGWGVGGGLVGVLGVAWLGFWGWLGWVWLGWFGLVW